MLLRMSIWIREFTTTLTNGTQVDMTRLGLKVWQRLTPFSGGDQGIIHVVSALNTYNKVPVLTCLTLSAAMRV